MSRLDSHVAAVRRKLALGIFFDWLAMAAFVLAVLALLAIAMQKLIAVHLPIQALWIGLGGVVLVGLVMAIFRLPSTESAAVAIDERLELKEKFSTALHVRAMEDPFAKAVVLDAEQTAQRVHLSGQFPIRIPKAGYWALIIAAAAVGVLMLPWQFDLLGRAEKRQARAAEERRIAEARSLIKEAIAKIDAAPRAIKASDQVQVAKRHLEDVLKQQNFDPAVASRTMVDSLSKVNDAMKQQAKENQSYAQDEMNKTQFASSLTPPLEDKTPVAKAHREIVKGNYDAAAKQFEQAVNDFNKMSPKEKEQMAQQMQNLANQLQQMAQDPRAMQKMANQMQQMGVNQQQIQQAQKLMQQAAAGNQQAQQQLQQMQQQLAQQMQGGAQGQQAQQMQQAMQQAMQAAQAQCQAGQMAQGAQQMAQAMQQAMNGGNQGQPGQMGQGQQQMANALQQMQAIQQDAQQMKQFQQQLNQQLAQAGGQCNNPGDGQGKGQGQGGQWQAGDPNGKQGQGGQGGPAQAFGRRPDAQAAPYDVKVEKSPSAYDKNGQHLASVYIQDRSVKGDSKLQLKKAIEAGRANEGSDVDDSRPDRRTQEIYRKYFNVLGEAAGSTGDKAGATDGEKK